MDAIPAAWLRRNVFQPWEGGPCLLVMYLATVDYSQRGQHPLTVPNRQRRENASLAKTSVDLTFGIQICISKQMTKHEFLAFLDAAHDFFGTWPPPPTLYLNL